MKSSFLRSIFCLFLVLISLNLSAEEKKLAYLVSDLRIPFWNIMWKGVQTKAEDLGYGVKVYSAENSAKKELENTVSVIKSGVDGIILSPTNSSAAVTVLKLAAKANIPVVVSDIGTQGGEFVSYIESDNFDGAYRLGLVLVKYMKANELLDGRVGIVSIPQKRKNGKLRTEGFLKALNEANVKAADIRQQVDFSYAETYKFSKELIEQNPDLKALWLQGSDRYRGALDAIQDSGKQGAIALICFDAEPEFVNMIMGGKLVGSGMQQPFLMGQRAVESLELHRKGKPVPKVQQMEVLAVSGENIESLLPLIQRNVLGKSVTDTQ